MRELPRIHIGEICKTAAGGTPLKSKKEFYERGDIPWLLSGEVSRRDIESAKHCITELGLTHSSAKIFPKNSVLVAMYGATAGQVGILRFEAATNQAVCGIYPNERLIPEYLYYALLHKQKDLVAKAAGNAQPNISQTKIRNTEISNVSIAAQKRIVAILDEAFAGIETAIANTTKNLANVRELFDRYLNTALSGEDKSWEHIPLSDVCNIESSLVDPRESEYADLPHVGAGNMESKTGDLANVLTAREEGLKSGKYVFDESMVLYSKIRPYLEKVARPEFDGLCSADVYPLSPSAKRLSRDFLFYTLLSKKFTDYAIAGSARAGMPKVNRDHLFRYAARLPPLAEQERMVANLDEIASESQRLQSIFNRKLNALNELKQSLLQKAFSGELTADRTEREVESATI